MPVKIALLNNEYLGMVRQQQQVQYKGNLVEVDLAGGGPDYIKLAQAYGIPAWRVTEPSQLDDAIGAAMAYPGPAIIEFRVVAHRGRLPVGARRHVARRGAARYPVRTRRAAKRRRLAAAGPSCQGCERPMSKHTLVATVEEGPVVLNRVLSLFRQRSFAIESLRIGRTNEPGIMRLTMVVDGARSAVEQVTKQLYKVIEVRKVSDLTEDPRVERELALIKVSCKAAPQRAEVMQIADIYRARIVDVATSSLMVEVTGPTVKVDSLIELFRPYGVKELVRTGVVAMSRGQAVAKSRHQSRIVSNW